jgi:pSer/pThr/pTyr-binding forkhead associated (FHA) protein
MGDEICQDKLMPSPAFLTLHSDQHAKNQIQKNAVVWVDDFLIGSDRVLCDLYLDDRSVSDRHARIIHRESLFFLMDVGSQEGTCIGRRRLYSFEESPLKNGDTVSFGKIVYLFSYDANHKATQQKG